ncbi:MAG: hypothetical protein ABSG63_11760 [Spirochaetia bacterium]|jgi:hypothetical protein
MRSLGWDLAAARAIFSLLTAILVLPAFLLKGFAFRVFLAAALGWCEMAAIDLWRSQRPQAKPFS